MIGKARSVLVLCVDRDNDVGEIAGVATPIMGEEPFREAATKFAIKRPDDSDSNAMFAALKIYSELKNEFEQVEVALIAGHRDEGIKADTKIAGELDQLLSAKKFDTVVLVSDGPTDELVLPVIQSRLPVLSIHRVVVQQSRGVEESFLLVLRYVKRLFEEEKYKKYALGVPGALVSLYVFLSFAMPSYVWPFTLLALGLGMAIKGFSLDEFIKNTYKSSPVIFASLLASLLITAFALAAGFASISRLSGLNGFEAIGYFLLSNVGEQILVLDLLIVSLLLPLAAQMLEAILGNKRLSASDYGAVALTVLLRQILLEYSKLLTGSGSILTMLLWIIITLIILSILVAARPIVSSFTVKRTL
ncbi:MAG: DUF373 family protein [Thermofilaceae archaeon]